MKSAMKLILIGAGGHGRVVADLAQESGYKDICFVDSKWPEVKENLIWPIIGNRFEAGTSDCHVMVTIGSCSTRLLLTRQLLEREYHLPVLLHPSAAFSQFATAGAGTVVMPQVAINAGARLGAAVIANTGCTIDHDCELSDGVHVSPGAHIAGGVKIGEATWVGIGSCIRENISVGKNVVVAAGSVVVSNIPDNAIVMGIPAQTR